MAEQTFKVGDKVRIKDINGIGGAVQKGFKSGDEAEVYEVVGVGFYVRRNDGLSIGLFNSEAKFLEIVTDKEQAFKVGDKVRILDASKIAGGRLYYYNGMETEVLRIDDDGDIYLRDKNGAEGIHVSVISELHAIEKISEEAKPKSTKNQRITTLEQTVDRLNARIEKLEAIVKAKNTRPAREFLAELRKSTTPNQRRKAIIDEAKAFVAELVPYINGTYDSDTKYGKIGGKISWYRYKTDFIVNEAKRTVVVLLKKNGTGELAYKAIAKCAPDDVFNADIGKAIALGRALGLDVERFEKAVQPSEVVTGMHVDTYYIGSDEKNETCPTFVTHVLNGMPAFGNGTHSSVFKITDDTEAQY